MTLNSKADLAYPSGVNVNKSDVIDLFNDFADIDDLKASDTYPDNTILKLQSGQIYKIAGAASDAGITDADITGTNNKFYEYGNHFTSLTKFKNAVARGDVYQSGDTVTAGGVIYQNDGGDTVYGLDGWTCKSDAGPCPFTIGTVNKYGFATEKHTLIKQGTGSGNVIQGGAVDPLTGELFTLHVTGDPETAVINKFTTLGVKDQTSNRFNSVSSSLVGHQPLSLQFTETGLRRFWSAANETVVDYAHKAIRFSIEDGTGTELDIGNVRTYQLFETSITAYSPNCTVACDFLGRYLVAELQLTATTNLVRIFDMAMLAEGGEGDYSTQFVSEFVITDLIDSNNGLPLQGLLMHGNHIMVVAGDGDTSTNPKMGIYSIYGDKVYRDDNFNIGEDEAAGDGAGTTHEVEGLMWWPLSATDAIPAVIMASGDAGARVNRVWALGADVVTQMDSIQGKPSAFHRGPTSVLPDAEFEVTEYDAITDTHTTIFEVEATTRKTTSSSKNSGALLVNASDNSTAGSGNISVTTGSGTWRRGLDGRISVSGKIDNIDTTGLTGASNLYLHISSTGSGDNFVVTGEDATPFQPLLDGFTRAASVHTTIGYHSTAGHISIRELKDGVNHVIANVSQFTSGSADIEFSFSYIATS